MHAPGCSPAQALPAQGQPGALEAQAGAWCWRGSPQADHGMLPAQIQSQQHSVSHTCFVFPMCVMVMLTLSCSLVSVHWHDV